MTDLLLEIRLRIDIEIEIEVDMEMEQDREGDGDLDGSGDRDRGVGAGWYVDRDGDTNTRILSQSPSLSRPHSTLRSIYISTFTSISIAGRSLGDPGEVRYRDRGRCRYGDGAR